MKLEDYDAVASVARGTWYLTKLILRRFMLRKGSGRIINLTSVVGHTGNPGQIPYVMVKAGLDAFSKSLAQELAGPRHPGQRRGPRLHRHRHDGGAARRRSAAAIVARIPQQRMGRPDEVADAVAWLATRASYVNGCVLHVNGGLFGG